ncbi:MAG: 3-oxoacyl-ACP reductase FabG [Ignavibacterium sp.]
MSQNSNNLKGKIALITGGSRGIGKAIAIALANAGAEIVVNYNKSKDEADKVCSIVENIGRRCISISANVSVSSEVSKMIEIIEKKLGQISILINNAGVAHSQDIEGITEENWNETIDVNLKSIFLVTQAVLPHMRGNKWGRIINMSSIAAQTGGIIGPHYAASKAGIIGLTHSYSSILSKEGITVNAIAPALIETEMILGNPKAQIERIPVGRYGTIEEITEVVVMLVKNGFITGQTININGGLYFS